MSMFIPFTNYLEQAIDDIDDGTGPVLTGPEHEILDHAGIPGVFTEDEHDTLDHTGIPGVIVNPLAGPLLGFFGAAGAAIGLAGTPPATIEGGQPPTEAKYNELIEYIQNLISILVGYNLVGG